MNKIGTLILHKRYGKVKVTHIWRILIDPIKRITRLKALTFEILTKEGKEIFQRDRRILFLNKDPLPRCYEDKLHLMKLDHG